MYFIFLLYFTLIIGNHQNDGCFSPPATVCAMAWLITDDKYIYREFPTLAVVISLVHIDDVKSAKITFEILMETWASGDENRLRITMKLYHQTSFCSPRIHPLGDLHSGLCYAVVTHTGLFTEIRITDKLSILSSKDIGLPWFPDMIICIAY